MQNPPAKYKRHRLNPCLGAARMPRSSYARGPQLWSLSLEPGSCGYTVHALQPLKPTALEASPRPWRLCATARGASVVSSVQHSEGVGPATATRGKCTATKTQHSHNRGKINFKNSGTSTFKTTWPHTKAPGEMRMSPPDKGTQLVCDSRGTDPKQAASALSRQGRVYRPHPALSWSFPRSLDASVDTVSTWHSGQPPRLSYYKNNPSNTREIVTTLKIPIIIG